VGSGRVTGQRPLGRVRSCHGSENAGSVRCGHRIQTPGSGQVGSRVRDHWIVPGWVTVTGQRPLGRVRSQVITLDRCNCGCWCAAVPQCNVMQLGRCNVGESKTASLTLSNHSDTDSVRFQWPEHSAITFSPRLGHLHPGRSKVIYLLIRCLAICIYISMMKIKIKC